MKKNPEQFLDPPAEYTDFPRAIGLLESGLVKVEPMITHTFSLSEGVEAFDIACNKALSQAVKIIINCES